MKAFITGIRGFAGTYLARHLLEKNYEVTGVYFGDEPCDDSISQAACQECNILDGDTLKKIVQDVAPDFVFHLAAVSFVPESLAEPLHTWQVNVIGTLNLYEALRQLDSLERVVFIGSASQYGARQRKELLAEDAPLIPRDPYGASKAAAETATLQYHRTFGLPAVVLRPFNHTGPGQSSNFVCSNFARQIARIEKGEQDPVIEVGNLSSWRDFTDVRDIVRAYRLAAETCQPSSVYNVSSGEARQVKEVLEALLDMTGLRKRVTIRAERLRAEEDEENFLAGDCSRFVEATGWKRRIDFADTLHDILEYWRHR